MIWALQKILKSKIHQKPESVFVWFGVLSLYLTTVVKMIYPISDNISIEKQLEMLVFMVMVKVIALVREKITTFILKFA